MTRTSDLLPQASGSASLGVNQMNQTGFNANLLHPYNNIHMISGVWHDPILGQSGVIRYAQHQDLSYIDDEGLGADHEHHVAGLQTCFELSIDGGMTFPLLLGATHTIASGTQGGGESFMAEGGGESFGFESHVDEAQQPQQVAVIRTQNGFRHDLYVYASGIATIVGSRKLRLLGFGSVDDPNQNDYDVELYAAHGMRAASVGNMLLTTASGNITLEPGLGTGNGNVILFAADSNSWFHFRKYGIGNAFGGDSPHQAWHVRNSIADIPGGPLGNGEWPIAHSGQVAAMIAAAGGGSQSLQAAYDGGDQINLDRNVNDRNVGIVLREANGVAMFDLAQPATQAHLNYGIAVSGGTGANGFALTKLIPNGIYIKSSGTAALAASSFVAGYLASNPQAAFIAANHDLAFFAFRDISYDAGRAAQPGGQINLSAFIGSGQLEYRYGPHQSWAMKVRNISTGGPASDGFWPIPHSGYIDTMILRAIKTKAILIERPAVNQDLTMWYTNEPITVTEVESVVRGAIDASGSFSVRYGSDRSAVGTELTTLPISCTNRTTGQITTSFAAPNIPADNWVWIGVSGVSGVATQHMNVTLQYR